MLWNNALVSAISGYTSREARENASWWGRLVENAVGSHLLNSLPGLPWQVEYWREGDQEVDYVVRGPRGLWALEVKSSRARQASGLAAFQKRWPDARSVVVGAGGIPLEEFFLSDPADLLRQETGR